jgi:hypothetical protein
MTCRTAVNRASGQAPIQETHTPEALREFVRCASSLQDLLYDDRPLDDEEFLFMKNHFQNLQMAFFSWKQRYRPADDDKPADAFQC